jgi:hypothetical protein
VGRAAAADARDLVIPCPPGTPFEGPVDLTIYGPGDGRAAPASRPATPDPEYHEVLVEATLDVGGRGPRGGRARFVLRTDKGDRPGQYIAVFRRTDVSSRPVAACRFQLRR